MRRPLLLVGIMAAVVGTLVLVEQRIERERQYRVFLAQGEARMASGATSSAIEAFSGALALRPSSMVAHLRRGQAYQAAQQTDDAVRDLREAAALAPDSTAPFVALGDLYAASDPTRAAEWYGQAAARLTDQDPALLYKLALAQFRAGAPAAAIDPLQRAIARDDSVGDAHYLLALAYHDVQRQSDAIHSLERAVQVAPSQLAAREELADLYRTAGRPADEMAQLQALAALDPRPTRQAAIALAEARQGQFDSAVATIDDARRLAPTDPGLSLVSARIDVTRGEQASDRTAVTRAICTLTPSGTGAGDPGERLALLGRAQYLAGDASAAVNTLHDAVRTLPVTPDAFAYLADADEKIGRNQDARAALLNLDALEGDTAPSSRRAGRARRIGTLSMRLDEPGAAAVAFGDAVQDGLADGPTLALLAQSQWQAGARDQAKASLARGLAVDPHNADLTRLARVIR